MILHAGDLADESVLIELEALAPVKAVYGNVDSWPLRRTLPRLLQIPVGAFEIGLIHGDGPDRARTLDRAARAFPRAHCVVFGHSHQPMCEWRENQLLFNPGSPTDRRRSPRCSYGFLYVGDQIEGEIRWL